jgi:hypothetical protein
MTNPGKHFDAGSLIVILVTLALFVAALFVKGLSHDLFLEAGVFLVSVKIILMSYRNSLTSDSLAARLEEIQSLLGRLEARMPPPDADRP